MVNPIFSGKFFTIYKEFLNVQEAEYANQQRS